ncbi:MAG TPA: hypothetical protein VIV37_05730, partial [Gaiellaceae bacterium]
MRAPDRHDGNFFGLEIPPATCSQRHKRSLVAHSLDEHDRAGHPGSSAARSISRNAGLKNPYA